MKESEEGCEGVEEGCEGVKEDEEGCGVWRRV